MENEERQAIHPTALDEQEAVRDAAIMDKVIQDANASTLSEWMDKECLSIDISSNWLDANQDLEMPEYMLSWKDTGFFPLGSINSITGHKKQGKTMFEILLMAAVLNDGKPIGPLRYELHDTRPNPKVLFIDTEQEMSYSLMVQRRVHYLLGWEFKENNPRFRVLWLHDELTAKERYDKMCVAIWTMKPDIVFIDGCRDMVKDINDAEESTTYIRRTMKIATDTKGVLSQALHYNPGSDKMRGWLGTELGNRIAYSIEITKTVEDDFTKMSGKFVDCRGKDVRQIDFYIDDSVMKFGVPCLLDGSSVTQVSDKQAELRERVKSAMLSFVWPAEGLHYKRIESGLRAYGITSNRMLSDYISIAINEKYITKNDQKKRYFIMIQNATVDSQSSLDDDGGASV